MVPHRRHSPEVLKRLVLPDGSVFRALLPGRPTRDSLFVDPTRDGSSALKVHYPSECASVGGWVREWE